MSLVNNSSSISDYIKIILEKYVQNQNDSSLSEYYEKLIKVIFDTCFQCFSKKPLLKSIENSSPQHFEIAKSSEISSNLDDIWIFGYGSLIWKVDFPFEICHRGYICNYERRFYQNSLDHRGTPEQPGRVVTCIPSVKEARVYGMAYKIPSNLKDEVLSHLDYREKNGYERCSINFFHYPDENQPNFKVIMYIATADNESYAGHISDIKNIAEQIYWAWGPSGSNREYVYNLSAAMKMLFPDVIDAHLFELENELRQKETLDEEISNQIESHLKVELPKLFENNITCNNLSRDIDNLLRKLKRNHYQP